MQIPVQPMNAKWLLHPCVSCGDSCDNCDRCAGRELGHNAAPRQSGLSRTPGRRHGRCETLPSASPAQARRKTGNPTTSQFATRGARLKTGWRPAPTAVGRLTRPRLITMGLANDPLQRCAPTAHAAKTLPVPMRRDADSRPFQTAGDGSSERSRSPVFLLVHPCSDQHRSSERARQPLKTSPFPI